MDVALIPSKATEGTSLSCLEAMGVGCAVIASYVGGLSDLIIEGYNGRLIKPTVENLVSTLVELIEDSEKRAYLWRNARETSLSFTLDMWRLRWARVIGEVFR
ncbi:MAG: glycosyltransferase family 4 protein [Firmicutes bacterium]|nr:glycosyltransferase family 4 protein [Bacillota bacterium]